MINHWGGAKEFNPSQKSFMTRILQSGGDYYYVWKLRENKKYPLSLKYTSIVFLQLPAGILHPRGWDKDLLVKLPVDRKGSCSVIPRKLSCEPLVLVEIRRGKARNKILLTKGSFTRQTFKSYKAAEEQSLEHTEMLQEPEEFLRISLAAAPSQTTQWHSQELPIYLGALGGCSNTSLNCILGRIFCIPVSAQNSTNS